MLLPEYFCILQSRQFREARATREPGGAQVGAIIIRLPDVEVAILAKVQKRSKAYKDIQALVLTLIRQKYEMTSRDRSMCQLCADTNIPTSISSHGERYISLAFARHATSAVKSDDAW